MYLSFNSAVKTSFINFMSVLYLLGKRSFYSWQITIFNIGCSLSVIEHIYLNWDNVNMVILGESVLMQYQLRYA